jgi:putative phage-type endonuclease
MEYYYELVMSEYDTQKGYDIYEIDRCIDVLQEYLYDSVGYDDDTMGGLMEDEIEDIVEDCRVMMHDTLAGVPCEVPTNDPDSDPSILNALLKIEPYRGGDQQRTDEWYTRRRGMITASIARSIMRIDYTSGKGIGVLRDKIIPKEPVIEEEPKEFIPPSNPDAPAVRGVRYEPIIRQIYENMNEVKVEEYDCVPHPEYPFLGASPDGIVTEGRTKGRMVEIKCPQPDSIIKDGNRVRPEYWSQMQLQMEVCGLDTCDYVRAVIREAPTLVEIQTLARSIRREYQKSAIHPEVGQKDSQVIAAGTIWMDHTGKYHGTNPVERKFRHEDSVHKHSETEVLFIRHYIIFAKDWFTVTVRRNRDWFLNAFLPKAREAWEEIQRGRADPVAWQEKYPLRKRGNGGESMTTTVFKSPQICLLVDD